MSGQFVNTYDKSQTSHVGKQISSTSNHVFVFLFFYSRLAESEMVRVCERASQSAQAMIYWVWSTWRSS